MKINDQIKFFQEFDSSMDYVETNCRKLYINPPIVLKKDHFYIVEVTETSLTVFESIAYQSNITNSEIQ